MEKSKKTFVGSFFKKLKNIRLHGEDVIYMICLVVSFLLLKERCRYSFGFSDEAFYLAVPYRMIQGDVLFVDEWNITQLTGFLLAPLVGIVLKLFGLTRIILIFRYIYICVSTLAAFVLYLLLKKYSRVGAAVGTIAFLWYVPFGINALSYNSIGVITLSLSTAFWICERNNKRELIISGIFFACAVLCNPFLVLLYAGFVVVVVVSYLLQKDFAEFLKNKLLFMTIGISIVALIFILYFIVNCSWSLLIKSIDAMFSFPSNYDFEIMSEMINYFPQVFGVLEMGWIFYICYFGFCITCLCVNNKQIKTGITILVLFLLVCHLVLIAIYNPFINHFMLPINFVAIVFYITYKNKTSEKLFWGIWMPGFVYSICMNFSSDTGVFAIDTAGAVMILASVIIIVQGINVELIKKREFSAVLMMMMMMIAFLTQISMESYYRCQSTWPDYEKDLLTEYIYTGPEQGLKVADNVGTRYDIFSEEIKEIADYEKVLFVSSKTWLYLLGDFKNASYSAWPGYDELIDMFDKLDRYYQLRPEKVPDVIYVEGDDNDIIERCMKMGYVKKKITNNGNVILRKN